MSGHSKWSTIKHKKGAQDAKRGKIFTKLAKVITVAAKQGGGDIAMNPALKLAIQKAKSENMPNNNIERAIKAGTGELKDAAEIMEVMYEGYGPGGVAIYIRALTDNKNRSLTNIRTAFTKNGGSLGDAGTVGYLFNRKGIIQLEAGSTSEEEIEMHIIEAGAEDYTKEDGSYEITTDPKDINEVKASLEGAGLEISNATITFLPETTIEITETEKAKQIMKLMDTLDEDDDVDEVYSNFDIPTHILESLLK